MNIFFQWVFLLAGILSLVKMVFFSPDQLDDIQNSLNFFMAMYFYDVLRKDA